MRVVITGGGGFLGSRLARVLLARGRLSAPDGVEREITRLVLLDAGFPMASPEDGRVEVVQGDVADRTVVERAVTADTAAVFHLAAVVSGAAEADFDLGMRANLAGTPFAPLQCAGSANHDATAAMRSIRRAPRPPPPRATSAPLRR